KINPKAVTITVDNASKFKSEVDPSFTGTIEGLVDEGDLGEIRFVRMGSDEAIGTYKGVLTAKYTANDNYDVTVKNGDFTIQAGGVYEATSGGTYTKGSGKTLVFADTHFDHISDEARQNSAKLVMERMYPITEQWSLPFFITGDFNCDSSSKGYKTLTGGTDEIPALIDSAKIAKERIADVKRTWNDLGQVPADQENCYIDFIFVDGKVEVEKFVVCPDTRDGKYPSDHNAIWAEVKIVD
ncbi:MAG: hypothetical protein J6S27_01020, partial [Thermoguttaceae bacterium]|nr:hypothetical protein [Thermoguttaceae bacterium]